MAIEKGKEMVGGVIEKFLTCRIDGNDIYF